MLEVRYKTDTKKVTGWCGDEKQFGHLAKPGHTVVILDMPVPDKPIEFWIFNEDKKSFVLDPTYIEPVQPLTKIEARLTKLEEVGIIRKS